jgi:hypothetical protein
MELNQVLYIDRNMRFSIRKEGNTERRDKSGSQVNRKLIYVLHL